MVDYTIATPSIFGPLEFAIQDDNISPSLVTSRFPLPILSQVPPVPFVHHEIPTPLLMHKAILRWRRAGLRLYQYVKESLSFPGSSVVKKSTFQCRRCRFDPWVGKIPWRRKWLPSPVFLPGKSYGQRSLAGPVHGGSSRARHDLGTNQLQQRGHN